MRKYRYEDKRKKQISAALKDAYTDGFRLSNMVWEKVNGWNNFNKRSIGEHWIKTADQLSLQILNIRSDKEQWAQRRKWKSWKLQHNKNIDLLEKARCRDLVTAEDYQALRERFEQLKKELLLIKILVQKDQ